MSVATVDFPAEVYGYCIHGLPMYSPSRRLQCRECFELARREAVRSFFRVPYNLRNGNRPEAMIPRKLKCAGCQIGDHCNGEDDTCYCECTEKSSPSA